MNEQKEKAKYIEQAYRPFCSYDYINRIFNTKNSEDYLLKLRAEAAVDNMRLFRIMRHRYIQDEQNWDFTSHFSTLEFDNYLFDIPVEYSEKINLTYGFVFSNDPYGRIMRTDFGDIVCISEALRYFLYYMNLSFMDYRIEVPDEVRFRSLIIGLRTMLKTETLDFDQDPRGIIPDELDKAIQYTTEHQLQFIIGHEFSHHLLNHLDYRKTTMRSAYRMFKKEQKNLIEHEFYNYEQKEEFEADSFALKLLEKEGNLSSYYVQGALTFFGYMELFESVSDYMFPPSNLYYTHPSPESRYKKLLKEFSEFTDDNFVNTFFESIKGHKELLLEKIGYKIELFEMYGSHYLAEPNTKWRGRKLIDRVDYY